jgi:hypothetical protein
MPGTTLTVTAILTDGQGAQYTSAAAITVRSGSALEAHITTNPLGVVSGQPFMLIYQLWNRSISDTTLALTTTLPNEAQFVRSPFTSTFAYSSTAHAINWQRALKADRAVLAVAVISATRSTDRTIGFTTTLAASALFEFVNRVMLDPIKTFLPLIGKDAGAAIDRLALIVVLRAARHTARQHRQYGCQCARNVTSTFDQRASWASSAHGYGAIDPVFNAALFSEQQVKMERWCTQCHRQNGCRDIRWTNGIDRVSRARCVIARLRRTART